jgi:hypothetical protein
MKTKCDNCNGDGWYTDHSEMHYRNQGNPEVDCSDCGCPVQVQCEKCQATGYIEIPDNEFQQMYE